MYNPGAIGNILPTILLTHGQNTAGLMDLTASPKKNPYGAALQCKVLAGATGPTTATTFSLYRIIGTPNTEQLNNFTGNTQLTAGAAAAATSITVGSAANIGAKTKIGLVSQASPYVGELVTVTAVTGTTLTVSALINAYTAGAFVFLIDQTANATYTASLAASGVANTEYSTSLFPTLWMWLVVASNGDATQPVTVTGTLDLYPGEAD